MMPTATNVGKATAKGGSRALRVEKTSAAGRSDSSSIFQTTETRISRASTPHFLLADASAIVILTLPLARATGVTTNLAPLSGEIVNALFQTPLPPRPR